MSCSLPFSWRIKDYLEELWVHALQHEGTVMVSYCNSAVMVFYYCITQKCVCVSGQTQEEFDKFFWKTPLGRYIEKADPEMQTEFFQRYLQDFISMTMNVTCQEDLQVKHLKAPHFMSWQVNVNDIVFFSSSCVVP